MKNITITALVYLIATTCLAALNASAFHVASIVPSCIVGSR